MTSRLRLLLGALALAFLAAHLRDLPRTLEDLDSINFALGVESFSVAAHQPHPPGYPIFIGLAKLSTGALETLAPSMNRDRRAAVSLAIWNVIAGALAAFVLASFWIAVGLTAPAASLTTILAISSPLFWFTASRPLSDTAGLVAALAVQTLVLRGFQRWRADATAFPADWSWAAFGAGLIIGLRSQTLWLTGPLLVWMAVRLLRAGRAGAVGRLTLLAAAGALVWAVPLVLDTGGVGAYLAALSNQGAQDFTGVRMLWTQPTWRLLREALSLTFLAPWQAAALGEVMVVLAIIGAIRLWRGDRDTLFVITLAFAPYVVFHLLFQETVTLRYALPIVIPITGLAVIALSELGLQLSAVATAAIVAVSLAIGQPRLHAYAADGAPIFRAFQAMHAALAAERERPVLKMHHQVWWGVRRVLDWYRETWNSGPQPHPGDREWLAVVDHFARGRTTPVWLLTDLSRTDIAAFDPRTATLGGRYELSPRIRELVGGARLDGLAWWRIDPPAWMLSRGWSLTTELAGVTKADEKARGREDALALLRRSTEPIRIVLGGRYLSGSGGGAADVTATLDGTPIDRWTVAADPNWFVREIELRHGIPEGTSPYASLLIHVTGGQPDAPVPDIGLEQFDAAPLTDVTMAFADGWLESESNPQIGVTWRWTNRRSTLLVWPGNRDRTLTLTGESPLKNFDRAPNVVVSAGGRELARFSPAADFTQTIALPLDALTASNGRVTIETDLVFVPGERHNSPDMRQLGLKLFSVRLR